MCVVSWAIIRDMGGLVKGVDGDRLKVIALSGHHDALD